MKCKIPFYVIILALLAFPLFVNFAFPADCVKSYNIILAGNWYEGALNVSYNKSTNKITFGEIVGTGGAYIMPKRQVGTLLFKSDGTYSTDGTGTTILGTPTVHVMYNAGGFDYTATHTDIGSISDQQIFNEMVAAGKNICEACPTEKAAALAECGTMANVLMDESTCDWECKCVAKIGDYGKHFYFPEGSTPLTQGDLICENGCQVSLDTVKTEPPYECSLSESQIAAGLECSCDDLVAHPEMTNACTKSSTQISGSTQGQLCNGTEKALPSPLDPYAPPPDDPRENCDQAKADCMISCGGVNLTEVNECTENDGETGSDITRCECKDKISCDEEETVRAKACGGIENFEGFDCHMEGGVPVVDSEGQCIAPPDDLNCADYEASCQEYCGEGNNALMECVDRSYGPQVLSPCRCENQPSTCPAGRICPDDGVCQQGEEHTSADCSGDDDKDGCPNGQVCEKDGKCQVGESNDSYDCGGNNDGNVNNDPGGNGEGTGNGDGSGGETCPPGDVCANDGTCQAGEDDQAADCVGPGSGEEGEGGETGTENGLCPIGSVCLGDGICQASEPSTAVDCSGANYTATRIAQMTAVITSSDMLSPLKAFNLPSGGSSIISLNMGSIGGVHTFDFSDFNYAWTIIKTIVVFMASWSAMKIITLKGGASA